MAITNIDIYNPVNWQPRVTPLTAYNLNRMDVAIEYNRNRLIEIKEIIDDLLRGFDPTYHDQQFLGARWNALAGKAMIQWIQMTNYNGELE